eukprot:scaffold2553_cov138-Cylindrotheca_fusiformis.AAC.6
MSKRSTGARQRRRGFSPAKTKDPFHNGQTPACGELLAAIQDVFPELQHQKQTKKPSSDLGKLLRWQYLENRKARMRPPPPPLTASAPDIAQQEGAASAAKKKKKRKKKKKADGGSSHGDPNEEQNERDGANSSDDKSLDQSLELNGLDKRNEDGGRHPDENPSRTGLQDDQSTLNSSGYFFEQIKPQNPALELLSPTQFIRQIRPEPMLPNPPDLDEMDGADSSPKPQEEVFMFSPTQFLKRMPSQSNKEIPSIPALETEQKHNTPPTPNSAQMPNGDAVTTPSRTQSAHTEEVLNSPTHEWVPAESAESKVETPPGDAIKDPLTLPFLLTLSEGNGTTTTTIDGSLISAARACDEEPSRIETTRVLFEEWLGQLEIDKKEDRRKDYKSFVAFLQTRLHAGGQPLGIPYRTLQDACSNVACYNCRQEATAEVEKMRNQKTPIVLNASCLREESKSRTSAIVDSAFDYVALEEGHHRLAMEEEEVDLDTCLSFVLSDAKAKSAAPIGDPHLFMQAMTSKHLDALAEYWLPCGIEEDVMVTTVVQEGSSQLLDTKETNSLNSEEMRSIQERILSNEKDARVALDGLIAAKAGLLEDMEQIGSTGSPNTALNVDLKLFPILKKCDEQCITLMDEILKMLRIASSEKHHALADLQMHLWTSYLAGLNRALKACNEYYTNIGEYVDQRGCLPKIFLSPELRGLYQTLVEDKAKAWTNLCDIFSESLSSRVLKEFYTRSVWFESQSQSKTEFSPLDQDCHDLLLHISNWTETILGSRMSDIFKHRIANTESVLELLQKVVEPLAEQYATVERYFSAERNVYFANLRSQIVLVLGVKTRMRLLDQTEVESMAMAVLLMWRHTRTMQSRMLTSNKIPRIPLQLKRWMLQYDSEFDERRKSQLQSTPTHHQTYCRPGTGGKRRAMCVLAGLVYQWLGDRCREWKAEMAEKELLTDFGTDATNASNGGQAAEMQTKPNKKKKKKKKKTSPTPDTAPETGNKKESSGNNGIDISKELHSPQNGINEEQHGCLETGNVSNGKAKTTKPSDPHKAESETEHLGPETAKDASGGGRFSPLFNIDSFPTSVYVKDDRDLTSGRDFLIGRLKSLLASADENKVVFA